MHHEMNGSIVHDLLMRLLDRSHTTEIQLSRIEGRLVSGDKRMGAIEDRLTRQERLGKRVPRWEHHAKWALRYLIPAGALWLTGSLELALKMLDK